jgi:hypothetical protein
MDYQISSHHLALIIQAAAELGAKAALSATGKLKPYLTKAEAFRQYNRSAVEKWIEQGLITPRKDGNYSACWRINRLELDAIATAQKLLQFL